MCLLSLLSGVGLKYYLMFVRNICILFRVGCCSFGALLQSTAICLDICGHIFIYVEKLKIQNIKKAATEEDWENALLFGSRATYRVGGYG